MADETKPTDDWDFVPVKANKPINKESCQKMYWNLLTRTQSETPIESGTFISLLSLTKRCDDPNLGRSLKHVREAYASTMNEWVPGSYKRVLTLSNDQEEQIDKEAAYRTMQDYETWTTEELAKSLDWGNWLIYHTWFRAERTFATIGVVGTALATGRWIKNNTQIIKDIRQYWIQKK